jgi:hypothetical protein
VIALGLIFSFAYAAGDAEKGKALFNDTKFAGGEGVQFMPPERERPGKGCNKKSSNYGKTVKALRKR